MTLYKNKYRVETTRLRGYDYSQDGYYFVTVCVANRVCLLGKVVDGSMRLNEFGRIVNDCWFDLPNHYSNIKLDAFCVMPNHIHGIIIIDNTVNGDVETGFKPVSTIAPTGSGIVETGFKPVSTTPKRHGLFEFVRALKTFSARRINELRKSPGINVWQVRFHDHIVRNNDALERIREYIANNPKNWNIDKHHT
ncbi:MAG: transposase [Bacteroidetes bacterium]|nr:transposase [Bacteroidota bacterium]